jgi:hypothetical protein
MGIHPNQAQSGAIQAANYSNYGSERLKQILSSSSTGYYTHKQKRQIYFFTKIYKQDQQHNSFQTKNNNQQQRKYSPNVSEKNKQQLKSSTLYVSENFTKFFNDSPTIKYSHKQKRQNYYINNILNKDQQHNSHQASNNYQNKHGENYYNKDQRSNMKRQNSREQLQVHQKLNKSQDPLQFTLLPSQLMANQYQHFQPAEQQQLVHQSRQPSLQQLQQPAEKNI